MVRHICGECENRHLQLSTILMAILAILPIHAGAQMLAATTSTTTLQSKSQLYDYVLSACDRAAFASPVLGSIYPAERVRQYFSIRLHRPELQLPLDTKLIVLQGFKYGDMVPTDKNTYGPLSFRYVPHNLKDFYENRDGMDNAILEIETMGKRVKLQYKVLGGEDFVTEDPAEARAQEEKCPLKVRQVSAR